eukprot:127972-Chlamydomonas_euryale.AAC.1
MRAMCGRQVATELRSLILELYERHLSADGRSVSYKAMKTDPLFRRYVDATAELQAVRGELPFAFASTYDKGVMLFIIQGVMLFIVQGVMLFIVQGVMLFIVQGVMLFIV